MGDAHGHGTAQGAAHDDGAALCSVLGVSACRTLHRTEQHGQWHAPWYLPTGTDDQRLLASLRTA